MANKAIKYRIYPTTEQSIMFSKTFGCCRKVYNLMLSDKIEGYKATGKFPTVTPAKYKKDYPYLKEVDSLALANKQLDLQAAFRNTFSKSRKKNNGFPKFKSAKHSRKSYTTNNQKGTVAILDKRYIRLPKVGKVKAVIHRIPDDNWIIKSATVSQESDGRYYISVLFEIMLLMAYMWTVTAMWVLIISITVKAMINLPKHSADCLVCKALKSMKINLITILSSSAK